MSHWRRQSKEKDDLFDLAARIIAIYIFFLIVKWFTNKTDFLRWLFYGLGVAVFLFVSAFVYRKIKKKLRQRKLSRLLEIIRQAGLEDYIKNFISRFGLGQEKSKNIWTRRNYKFDWNRIRDLRDFLFQKGIRFSFSDIIILLSFYIDERERLLTYGSISVSTNSFSKLSGADFERLLYRLYEAMGYSVQIIGGVGDQGGDLIATKNQERILIQAKRWNNNVSNKAVQEAVAARNYYDCNKAIVVATNSFTKEATELARANGVELISKEILQKLLFDYLGESWN